MAGRPPTKEAPLFGQRLSSLRKEKGLTQVELAEALGISGKLVDYYERRCPNPNTSFVKEVASFFGVTVGALVAENYEAPKKPGPRSALDERVDKIKQLPRRQQELVVALLDAFLSQRAS